MAQLLQNSGLEAHGAIGAMRSHSAGVLHIEDYLKQEPGKRPGSGGIALGLTEEVFLYDLISYLSHVENWKEAYPRLTGSGEADTDVFMEKLINQQKPIVFFVPSHVTKHNGVTSEEVNWYLAHADKMKTTYFIFGLYDMVNKDVWEKYLLPREPHDLPIMTGILNNPQGHFIKGKSPHNPSPNSPEMEKELKDLKAKGDNAREEPLDGYLTRMDKLQEVPPRYNQKAKWGYRT